MQELFGGSVHPFLVIQKPMSAIFDFLSLMVEFSEPIEVIFTSKFSFKFKGPPGPIGEKYCIMYNFTV